MTSEMKGAEGASGPSLPGRIVLFPIVLYRRWISPGLPRRCKYEPTCSAYAVEAVSRFGAARGTLLAVWRLARCNPFSHGGFDPVRDEFTLRVGPMDPAVYHGERESCRIAQADPADRTKNPHND
jgi:putative membrane protein insertion efficiency factor